MVGGMHTDTFDVTGERLHQGRLPLDRRGPAEIVEHFVDRLVGDEIEEMLSIHAVAKGLPDKGEIGLCAAVGGVFRHIVVSPKLARRQRTAAALQGLSDCSVASGRRHGTAAI